MTTGRDRRAVADAAQEEHGFSRRDALRYAGLSGAGVSLAGFLAACGEGKPQEAVSTAGQFGKGITVRFFAGGDAGDAFASIVFNGAKAATRTFGPKTDYVFSGWDVEKMQTQLRDAIAAKPDCICMMGHAGDDALMPLARDAQQAGITMMWQNVDVRKIRAKYGGGYIGANLETQGRALGEAAIDQLNLKSGDRAIVFGAFGEPGRGVRERATAEAFSAKGLKVVKIVAPPKTAADPNTLTPLVSAAFRRAPTTKIIVYAGGQTLGSVPQYMDAIGKKAGEVYNIGFDLSPAVVKAMQEGFVQLTSDQEPYLQGYLPILSAVLARKYGFAPFTVDTGVGLVTKDQVGNVAKYARAGIR